MWLYLPSKSLRSAPAWECLEKDCEQGSDTWATRLAPSVSWSGKPIQPRHLRLAAKKAAWTTLLSGPTFSPSTVDVGVEQWIASLRASRAKTSAWPAGVLGLMAADQASSSTSSTSQTIAVREASFWRMLQASLLPQPPLWTKPAPPIMPPTPLSTELLLWVEKMDAYSNARQPASWGSFPTAGGMRSGSLFQRPTLAPVMAVPDGFASHGDEKWQTPKASEEESGSGLNGRGEPKLKAQAISWMTPSVSNAQGNEYTRDRGQEGLERLTLTGQANQWQTPQTSDMNGARVPDGKRALGLNTQTTSWPTPRSTDGTKGSPNQAGSKGDLMLPSMAAQWPTPSAAMMNDGESPESWQARADGLKAKHINGNGAGMPLTIAVKNWPTPASRDYKGQDLASRSGGASLSHAAETGVFSHSSPLDQATPDGPLFSRPSPSTPQRLNPVFGEWLMGWPSQWTKAEPSASSASGTVLWQRKLASHLSCLLDAPAGV